MRGMFKFLAMLGLAAGLSVVPAVGSQGAGALGARQAMVDAELVIGTPDGVIKMDSLAARAVLEQVSR